ncbi:MAG: NAD(P)H-binding protein [Gammaproteobacteria bacterium]|nr:NAD(P)H-binding protein [Gammaproteobacteria bacterium]
MQVAIFGGTGFVGSYLVDALVAHGMCPVLLVRAGHEGRVRHRDSSVVVSGSVEDDAALSKVIDMADAVIFNIGILREFPSRGVTFQRLQQEAACRIIDKAAASGVGRFLLMSANGVDARQTTYQRTKHQAERYLAASGLDWTVVRPSVIFGNPRGRSEFATQLYRDVIASPLPAPLFYQGILPHSAGQFELSPVHVRDVAQAFVAALLSPNTIGQVLELGGPESLTWKEILTRIAAAAGKSKLMLPVPAFGIAAAAALLDRFEAFPVTRDQLKMLMQGNTCGSAALTQLGISPTGFCEESLAYLENPTTEDSRWQRNAA